MIKCMNCKSDVRDTDIYCRNCGCRLNSNKHYIIINIFTILAVLGLVGLVILSVASYVMSK